MTHNPCNEDLLVVCGLTECQLLVINSSGQVTNRSLLHPSVGTGYIVKALWIPGSQYELVLISDSFVKIYDTHVDVICPAYYFVLDDGKIKDATVAVSDEVPKYGVDLWGSGLDGSVGEWVGWVCGGVGWMGQCIASLCMSYW